MSKDYFKIETYMKNLFMKKDHVKNRRVLAFQLCDKKGVYFLSALHKMDWMIYPIIQSETNNR